MQQKYWSMSRLDPISKCTYSGQCVNAAGQLRVLISKAAPCVIMLPDKNVINSYEMQYWKCDGLMVS